MSPALAGGFLTTVPPGKPLYPKYLLNKISLLVNNCQEQNAEWSKHRNTPLLFFVVTCCR